MKAFAKAVNEADSISINDTKEVMFAKWLSVITEKEINNKALIENACGEEEILMAVTALQRQSEDKLIRQAYQRRKDEIYFHKKEVADNILIAEQAIRRAEQEARRAEKEARRAEQEAHRAEQEARRAEQEARRAEQMETENEQLRKRIAELEVIQK